MKSKFSLSLVCKDGRTITLSAPAALPRHNGTIMGVMTAVLAVMKTDGASVSVPQFSPGLMEVISRALGVGKKSKTGTTFPIESGDDGDYAIRALLGSVVSGRLDPDLFAERLEAFREASNAGTAPARITGGALHLLPAPNGPAGRTKEDNEKIALARKGLKKDLAAAVKGGMDKELGAEYLARIDAAIASDATFADVFKVFSDVQKVLWKRGDDVNAAEAEKLAAENA